MKQLVFFFLIQFLLITCSETAVHDKTTSSHDSTAKVELTAPDSSGTEDVFKKFTAYKLNELILADLNGDGKTDTAKFVTREKGSGIIIVDGNNKKEFVIGCGTDFEGMGGDFGWVDSWGLLEDDYTFNIPVKDGELLDAEKVYLDNPGIVVSKSDAGGGVITFKNGKYIWLHQSC